MFLAGLILLLDAYRDKSLLLNPALASVKIIMASYAPIDPSANRYHRIFEEMETAISDEAARDLGQTRDILGELLYGKGSTPIGATSAAIEDKSPGDMSLSQFLNDGTMGFDTNLEDTFNFDFDATSYWDTMMAGDGEFRGTLLNAEF
jgi:hypothetical protein